MARILIVDDDRDVLKITSRFLKLAKHEVLTSEGPGLAFDLLRQMPFDAIITDANMPEMSGFEFIQTLRSRKETKNIAMALLTSRREKEDVQRGIASGVDDYIVKPIDPLILVQKIESLLQKRRPVEIPQVLLTAFDQSSDAYIKIASKILSVSELGLKIKSPVSISENHLVDIVSVLFDKEIQATLPLMKITDVEALEAPEKGYIIQVAFLAATDTFLQKIRHWINQRLIERNVKGRAS
ncbi:MAG: response regulator [Bdellovibrionales bacterium]|nr:response regulator [Bdellovibrionales bacterium]